MSRGYWRGVQSEVDRRLDAAEGCGMCLCVKSVRANNLMRRRRDHGELVQPYPLVYARQQYWRSLEPDEQARHVIRAVAALHPDWVFCNVSAALMYGLQVSEPNVGVVHILSPGGEGSRRLTHAVRHACPSKVRDAATRDRGVWTTSPTDALVGSLRSLSFPQGLAVGDSALRQWGMSRELVADLARQRLAGMTGLPRVLGTAASLDGRSENGGESVARGVMIELGYAVPELQVEVPDPGRQGHTRRIDFVWSPAGQRPIFGELDGREKYGRHEAGSLGPLMDERLRESLLTLYGASIMRIRWDDVRDPIRLKRQLDRYGVPHTTSQPSLAHQSHMISC